MPRLADKWFEAQFYCQIAEDGSMRLAWESKMPITFAQAQGLFLWCPCGYGKPEFPLEGARPHGVLIPFANPPCGIPCPAAHGPWNNEHTHRPRWRVESGSGLDDLTLSPSVLVGAAPGCWHGFIQNGEVK